MPVSDGRYGLSMGQTSAAGFGSIDLGLTKVQRKRPVTRKTSTADSIVGLITMTIQIIFTTCELLTVGLRGEKYLESTPLALLMMIVVLFVVSLGWIVAFILGLIACVRADSRILQV